MRTVIRDLARLSVFTLFVPLAMLIYGDYAPAAERYAFLVGVRQYDKTQLNDLQFTENDVTQLSATLQRAGYSKRNIVLMTQSIGASNARLAPFAKNVQKELSLLLREVTPGDSVLVAFSGHGVQLAGDAESYFCPADANLQDRGTLIPLGNVFQSLQESKATVKILLVDACRNDPLSSLGKSRRVVELKTLSRQAAPTPPGGIAAFFSCSKGEQSYEHPDLQHGIFFYFVIQALSGKADFDKDQEISLDELSLYAAKEVRSYSRNELGTLQTPERKGEARGLLTVASLARISSPNPTPGISTSPTQGNNYRALSAPFDATAAGNAQADWARRLGKTSHEMTNSIGMKLALIPPGEFTMGSPDTEQYHEAAEQQHQVRINRPFYMGVYEVTQHEYQLVMNSNPSHFCATGNGKTDVAGIDTTRYPVENVSYEDAQEFCRVLSLREGITYRLPTEAEWEWGCRAGTTTAYWNGPSLTSREANIGTDAGKVNYSRRTGTYAANPFGLYDMHGNVWEWCSDWYDANYYADSPTDDPAGPSTGSHRVFRGGSFISPSRFCRSAVRRGNEPLSRSRYMGFRVTLSPVK